MMPTKKATLPLVILGAVLLGGCAAPAQPAELKFRCVLPKAALAAVESDLATVFASRLAEASGLNVLSQTRQTGKSSSDVTYIVSLRSAKGVFVNILFNVPYRTVALTLSGDVQSPEAAKVAREASQVFSAVFPGSTLAPFSGNQALFGP